MLHPEPIFSTPNGLTIYKSKLQPWGNNEIACIGGPIPVLDEGTKSNLFSK